MVNYARVQEHIDRGKGIAARKLGPPYNAFRIIGSSAGDFPGGWSKVASNFPLFYRKLVGESKILTGLKNTTQWIDIVADMDPFVLGDIFLLNDPAYVPGVSYGAGATSIPGTIELNGMCLAWHPPVNKAIGGTINRLVSIYRPAVAPATQNDGSTYWESTHDNDQPLVLAGGSFAFGSAGAGGASLVPAGIGSAHRRGEAIFGPGVPGMLKPTHWFFYVPPLPGYLPREGDAIIDQNGARYVVVSPYEQLAGVVGYQLLCDRKVAQP